MQKVLNTQVITGSDVITSVTENHGLIFFCLHLVISFRLLNVIRQGETAGQGRLFVYGQIT